MRADRLVAILLMLQRREQVTAKEVAEELEVSERTARRDLDALGMAGIPVYSLQGRGGGWRLLGGSSTDLSGFTADEARALFLAAGPASAENPVVKAALRKLVRALPETFRTEAEMAATSMIVDPDPWGSADVNSRPPQFVGVLQDAIIQGRQVQLGYIDRAGSETERCVHPLGIVRKGRSSYLVTQTEAGRRTFRVDRVIAVTVTDKPSTRPERFDLGESWRQSAETPELRRTPVEVHGTCATEGIEFLRIALGENLTVGESGVDGRMPVVIRGPSEYGLAGHLAGLVEWLEITSPPRVREHLASIGAALARQYGQPAGTARSETLPRPEV